MQHLNGLGKTKKMRLR